MNWSQRVGTRCFSSSCQLSTTVIGVASAAVRSGRTALIRNFVPSAVTNWFLLGRFSTDRLRSALARALAQVSAATLRTRLAAVRAVDVSAQLAKLRVPVLYLRATEDRIVPAPASALVLRLLPSASIIELEAPHSMLQASPAEAARHVKEFAGRAVGP